MLNRPNISQKENEFPAVATAVKSECTSAVCLFSVVSWLFLLLGCFCSTFVLKYLILTAANVSVKTLV